MGNNIHWMFKNLASKAVTITESSGTSNTNYGTNNIADNDLNTSFRSNSAGAGTTTLLYDFGSAIYIDSVICIHNLPTVGGTMLVRGGTSISANDVTIPIPLKSKGTATKYTTSNGYRYWELSLAGTASGGYHEVNEFYLGKRLELNENPSVPFKVIEVEDVDESITERGQKFKYHNFTRKVWTLNYPAIPQASFESLRNMRRAVKGAFTPFFYCEDPTGKPEETHFVRMSGNRFTYQELISQTWDVSFTIEQEL